MGTSPTTKQEYMNLPFFKVVFVFNYHNSFVAFSVITRTFVRFSGITNFNITWLEMVELKSREGHPVEGSGLLKVVVMGPYLIGADGEGKWRSLGQWNGHHSG